MKKYKKIIMLICFLIIIIIGLIILLINLTDKDSLSIKEQKWIDENENTILSLTVPNDVPVFGLGGEGVFFDFSTFLTTDTRLNINNNTISYNSDVKEYGFSVSSTYDKNNLLLYKDHFVVISKNTGILTTNQQVKNLEIGVLTSDSALVQSYFGNNIDKIKTYDSYDKITTDLNNGVLNYAVVALTEYKDELIKNNINILFHASDLVKYYYFILGDDDMINSIYTKEFNKWYKEKFEESYNTNNYNLFIDKLGISSSEEDELKSKIYKYGFIENRPYEMMSGSLYGGITSEYLNSFEKFSGIQFDIKKYKSISDLTNAAINGDIDLYYNYYSVLTNFIDTGMLSQINYYVIASSNVDLSLSNIKGLANNTVYVLEKSYLYDLIKDIEDIDIKTYSSTKELNKIVNGNNIILVDANVYDYYINNITNNYIVRYKSSISGKTYSYKYKNDTDTFYKLFNAYTKTLNKDELLTDGINSYNKVSNRSNLVYTIAKCLLVILIGCILVIIIYRKKHKKLKLDTKVKKEDRLKYIDLLTSLKNRNYYNEKLNSWNKNKIYPQTCIVLDINNVKALNDTFGHAEGDKQILGVANILIRTQIDNTEVIRTDGNEFLIYMVGYSEKQVVSYINKLRKEFKKELPYNYGVAVGFSMIDDDTKLVEDAFNEASILMRENKSKELKSVDDEKKN